MDEIAFQGTALGIEQIKILKEKRAEKEKNWQQKDYQGSKNRKGECKDWIEIQLQNL